MSVHIYIQYPTNYFEVTFQIHFIYFSRNNLFKKWTNTKAIHTQVSQWYLITENITFRLVKAAIPKPEEDLRPIHGNRRELTSRVKGKNNSKILSYDPYRHVMTCSTPHIITNKINKWNIKNFVEIISRKEQQSQMGTDKCEGEDVSFYLFHSKSYHI